MIVKVQGFDRPFSCNRGMKESFAYRNALKTGTPEKINQVIKQSIKKEMEQGMGR